MRVRDFLTKLSGNNLMWSVSVDLVLQWQAILTGIPFFFLNKEILVRLLYSYVLAHISVP